ncbi:MAG: fumarylacetoacetate hydrolase family protein [Desulfobacteraceae bacterium]|jgi:2-keto-4-pentenoate hydratase/2-oxohepta-3-ene-1,7-dioic acid hydratase in catechol pathway
MQLVTFKPQTDNSRIGLSDKNKIADLRAVFETMLFDASGNAKRAKAEAEEHIPDSLLELIQKEDEGIRCIRETIEFLNRTAQERESDSGHPLNQKEIFYDKTDVKILKPFEVFRALNVGANYNAYLAMMDIIEPYEGTSETFWKLPQTVIGPDENIIWPVSSKQVSCEMELGVIIGKKVKRVSKKDAFDCIFGYTVVNDTTAIDLLKRGLGKGREGLPGFYYLCLAKSFDTFEAIGPGITLPDSIPDPQDLNGELWVNGELKVKGNTSDMRLKIAEMIEYISQDITLYPGDLIATGAMASEEFAPQVQVQIGDTVEMTFDRIGTLRNTISA